MADGAGAFGDKVMSHIDVSRTSVPISLSKKMRIMILYMNKKKAGRNSYVLIHPENLPLEKGEQMSAVNYPDATIVV